VVSGVSYPIISPDGQKVVFYGGEKQLWIIDDVDNVTPKRLTDNFARNTLPAFSPNGDRLVFFEKSGDGLNLAVVNTMGNPGKHSVHFDMELINYRSQSNISWSQSGRIVFALRGEESDYILILDEQLNETKRLNIRYPGAVMPAMASDGNRIVFTGRENGSLWLATLADDSPKYTELITSSGGEINIYPSWSDDGKYILFNKSYQDDPEHSFSTLFLIEPATKKTSILSNNAYRGGYFRKK
jgi:Tol biopolymer transport system component